MKKKIWYSALFLGLFSLLSRLVGVFREHFLAEKFGALNGEGIYNLDTYFTAFRIPDMLFNLLILGTISAVFVPFFQEYIAKNDLNEGWKYTNALLNLIIVVMIFSSVLLFFLVPMLIKFLAPSFDGINYETTVNLTRIMLLSPIIFSISSLAQSIQNAFSKFFFYALAPVLYNLGIIFGILFWSDKWGVYGVAFGVILGALLHLLVQIPMIYKLGYRYKLYWKWNRNDVRQSISMMGPRILGMSATEIMLLTDTIIASLLFSGAITVLNFAYNLQSLPLGVLGISFSIASFSVLSQFANNKNWEKFAETLRSTLSDVLFLIIPASIGMFLLRDEIVTIILRGGKFDAEDAKITADILGLFTLGLFAQSLIPILSKAFYSLKNTKIPFLLSLFAMILNVILSIILVFVFNMGLRGLVFSNVCANIFNFIFLLGILRKYLKINIFNVKYLIQVLICGFFMGIGVYSLKVFLINNLNSESNFFVLILKIFILIIIGALIYFGCYYLISKLDRKRLVK
ncbi:murein biosynthesis integral membrane protein MurJ [Candidatus Peregrinibacteria bacterium RIFOXYA2_FULL_33_7]|nr:MAG: integral membrane protein MviN, virulence factor [Candidatus Peregrinibacteria bacterium GW2011_GWC2_33_13]OGJ46943.1 MAG: murein biosynthesis integral membrane protein MurJ [Candidatus Peregrinibacteria bacterium RIFOXYA2_FULL_33_7]